MLLTDPLDADAVALLQLIHHGSAHGTAPWPVWQWVAQQAAQRGLDAQVVLRGLPQWQLHYRPVRWPAAGVPVPAPDDRLGLTVHGLVHVDGDSVLLPAFLAALEEACSASANHVTDPQEVRPLVLPGPHLLQRVRARSGFRGSEQTLHALLTGEPATWSGHTEPGPRETWQWDLTRLHLQPFAGLRDGLEYLERLAALVGVVPAPEVPALPLPPLALPEALDHLDAQWRLATGARLLQVRRTEAAAALALPVTSRAELQAALSALADLLDGLNPGGDKPQQSRSLGWLNQRLRELLRADDVPASTDAVERLRDMVALRADQQHSGSRAYRRAQQARRQLGLSEPPCPPEQEWEQLRHLAVNALRTLRLAVGRTTDRPTDAV